MLSTATILGNRYVLGSVIGRGGGADVFRADDTDTGREVAVKVLRSATPEDLQRFAVEAQTLERLDHPAIVRMCDRGERDGVPYLVLDLVDGEPLSQVLRRGPLPEHDVIRIGGVLAGALAHAHQLGIVHRDVKPGNVLFDDRGGVHLTDFGIARLTDITSITSKGMVIGTAAYLAPEQVSGEGASAASDIYALGLVLIETLTGEAAFTGTASEAAIARLHRQPVVPHTSSPALAMLLTAMTAADPSSRPTAERVADSLTADATATLPVAGDVTEAIPIPVDDTRVEGPVVLVAPPDRRRLIPWAAIATVLALLLFGWLGSGSLTPAASSTPPPATLPTTAPPPSTAAVPDTTPPAPAKHGNKKKGG